MNCDVWMSARNLARIRPRGPRSGRNSRYPVFKGVLTHLLETQQQFDLLRRTASVLYGSLDIHTKAVR